MFVLTKVSTAVKKTVRVYSSADSMMIKATCPISRRLVTRQVLLKKAAVRLLTSRSLTIMRPVHRGYIKDLSWAMTLSEKLTRREDIEGQHYKEIGVCEWL